MRVLHLNCNYIGTTLHQLMVESLDRRGYDNRVFVPSYDKSISVIRTNENVTVCECFRKWDRLFFDYKQHKIRKALEANVDVAACDLIHAYTLFTDGNSARNLSKQYGIPFVAAVRNTDVNVFFRYMPHLRNRGIRILRDAKAVFFLSEAYKAEVFNKYVPASYRQELMNKSYVLPNGIDNFWFDHCPEHENRIGQTVKLIYAGRIDRNKNIVSTQKAMEILREKGYHVSLTVVGKVDDESVYETIKADPYTECIPAQPKEELLKLYRQHNIFVMPSFTETFGLVYAEAMSQGLPVIYSKGQGFDNQFPEGTVGYHVSSKDVHDIAAGIERLLKQFDQIKQNVVCCSRSFNWDSLAEQYDRIYQSIGAEERKTS